STTDFAEAEGRTREQWLGDTRQYRIAGGTADCKWNNFHGRDHLAGNYRLVGRQRGQRGRLVDPIETVDRILIDNENTSGMREQIGAAGEGAVDMDTFAGNRFGDFGSGDVLRDIARFEPRDHDLLDTGSLQRSDLGGSDRRAFFEHESVLTNRVHGGRAERFLHRHCAELHDAAVAGAGATTPSAEGSLVSAAACSRSVVCAMIGTGSSAGANAPRPSPIGAWMRAISVSLKPCALSRSTRRA